MNTIAAFAEPTTTTGTAGSWARETLVLTGRQLLTLVRDKATAVQLILVPIAIMVMFTVVLGDAVGRASGQDSSYSTVPLMILVSAMAGSLAAGIRLNQERGTGLLSRLYVLPIHRSADLTSRLLCEVVRIVVVTALLIGLGQLIGFHLTQGPLAVLGIFGVALIFGLSYATLVLTLAVNSRSGAPLLPLLSMVSSLLMFFNSGFSPVDAYPEWLQPVVENQPMTPAIEVMRSLASGGPITTDLVTTLAWSVGIIVVLLGPALRGYRKAATSR